MGVKKGGLSVVVAGVTTDKKGALFPSHCRNIIVLIWHKI
jgi:hypothetical protein